MKNELIAGSELTRGEKKQKKTHLTFLFFSSFFFTFDCSLEEDLAAATGEDAVVAARSLVGAHQTDLRPALSLSRGRSFDRFLSGGSAAGTERRRQEREVSRLFSFARKLPCGISHPELFF